MALYKKNIPLVILLLLAFVAAVAQEQAMNHIIAAREYLLADNTTRAKQELDSALAIAPNNALANALMGDLLNNRGNYLKALLSYDKAILANPNDAELYLKRARLHDKLNNHQAYIIGDYDRAIALAPRNTAYYIEKAQYIAGSASSSSSRPDYPTAVTTISQAITFNQEKAELYYLRSKYLFGAGQNLAALADINKAITLNQASDKYMAQKGYINFMIGNYRNALADYTRAIRINDRNPTYHEFKGHANYNLSRYAAAYDDYSTGIDLLIRDITGRKGRINNDDPANKQLRRILLYRGMSLVQEGKPYDGCDDFKRAYRMGETKARNYMRKYCN